MADPLFPSYRRSARSDFRLWLLLAVGALFFCAGSTIDPADNCSADGRECAPWLVPLAQGMGALFTLGAGLALLANPNRGSRIDPSTGELIWWQGRIGASGGDEGRIHPSRIGRVRIVRQDDSADEIHLYDLAGDRLFWFDAEVVPWPPDRWAAQLTARWPHIEVEHIG
ncbi:MAG: hypothetical protein CVT78_07525 [Alphaproteobacteria bacterium HGW-Alphaproteobacteria-17]|nr:MAG: hypothetical protein CVT78_07525 [Alphaproteobacteria bacterium HGW-Alphaproteobacteria-17]